MPIVSAKIRLIMELIRENIENILAVFAIAPNYAGDIGGI